MAEDENETAVEGEESRKKKATSAPTDRSPIDIAPSERLMIVPPPMTAPVIHHPNHDPRSYTPGPYLNYYDYPPPGAQPILQPPAPDRFPGRMPIPAPILHAPAPERFHGYPPFGPPILHNPPHGPILSPPGGLHYPHPFDHRNMI